MAKNYYTATGSIAKALARGSVPAPKMTAGQLRSYKTSGNDLADRLQKEDEVKAAAAAAQAVSGHASRHQNGATNDHAKAASDASDNGDGRNRDDHGRFSK